MDFEVPPSPTLSFHPQELSWDLGGRRGGGLGAGTTLHPAREGCWVTGEGKVGNIHLHRPGPSFTLESFGSSWWSGPVVEMTSPG